MHILQLNMKSNNTKDTMNKELKRRQDVLDKLYKHSSDIDAEHHRWMQNHLNKKDTEMANKIKIMEKEKAHMREIQHIEEEISRQRVESMWSIEKAAREEFEALEKSSQVAQNFIEAQEKHLQEKMDLALNIQRHRELAENTQTATEERLRTLYMRRTRDEFIKGITNALQSKEAEIENKNQIITESWKKQDEEWSQRRADRITVAKELASQEAQRCLQDEMTQKINSLLLTREAKVIEIERSRAMRHARDVATEANESAERSYLYTQKQELEAATEKAANLAAAGYEDLSKKLMVTIDKIRQEASKLIEAEKVHALRQREARSQAQEALLRQQWAEQKGKLMQGVLATENSLQNEMIKITQGQIELELQERNMNNANSNITKEKAPASQYADTNNNILSNNNNNMVRALNDTYFKTSGRPSSYSSSNGPPENNSIALSSTSSSRSTVLLSPQAMRAPDDADIAEQQLRNEQTERMTNMRASIEAHEDERDIFLQTQLANHSSSSSNSNSNSSNRRRRRRLLCD